MNHPWPPSGIVTRQDGSWDFDFTAYPSYPDEWVAYRRFNAYRDAALIPPDVAEERRRQCEANRFNATYPAPPDGCDDQGCWCRAVPGEAFHCAHCRDAFDIEFQCRVHGRWCVNCCGHSACANAWYTDHYLPV